MKIALSKRKVQEAKLEKSRRLYATVSQVNKMIIYARESDDLFRRLCSVIVDSGKFRMAWVGIIDRENRTIVPACHAGHEDGYLSLINISIDPGAAGMGPTATAMRELRHYICNDIRTDPAIRPWKEEALRRGYRSSMALPIFKFGEPYGTFSLYSDEYNFFDEEEVRMLDEVVRDISFTLEIFEKEELRKKAEKGIRIEKQFSDSIINMLPGVFYMYDEQLHFQRWNRQFEEITGYSHDEFAGKTVLDLFQGSQRDLIQQKTTGVFDTGYCDVEAELTTRNGRNIPFYFSGTKISYRDKPCVLGIGFDISRSKEAENLLRQSEEDLRDLASSLQNVREEERAAIAREIHDELGQQLTAIKLDVSWLDRKITGDDLIKERITGILIMLTEMIQTIRRISTQLRPSILDDLGLIEALKWLVRDFQKRTGIHIQFDCPEESIKPEPAVTTGLFRIFQETLTNITRHAEATAVLARLYMEDDRLILTVTDNGKGFDPAVAKKKKTLGLLGMKERALMMKGVYEIDSQPGKGTSLRFSVPLHPWQQPTLGA
ncbi:MAG TPA: GAF domain-containing protein [Puia sp.]|jgi:PAS domain S-box-containing protein|nr:GAF domain-containing protein [Puia sp.]